MRADGTLISAETRGSIHKVGAEVQGAPACNGWDFWHVMREGQPVADRPAAPAGPRRDGIAQRKPPLAWAMTFFIMLGSA